MSDKPYMAPTPYLGQIVWWYHEANDRNEPVPGIVNRIEDAGRVSIKVVKYNSFDEQKAAVYHMGHPIHDKRTTSAAKTNGGWDYIPGTRNKDATKLAEEQYEDRLRRQIEEEERQNALLAKKRADALAVAQEVVSLSK